MTRVPARPIPQSQSSAGKVRNPCQLGDRPTPEWGRRAKAGYDRILWIGTLISEQS